MCITRILCIMCVTYILCITRIRMVVLNVFYLSHIYFVFHALCVLERDAFQSSTPSLIFSLTFSLNYV